MSFIERNKVPALLLYFSLCFSLWLRMEVEATHYTSPDSEFYLRTAANILEGKGLVGPVTYPFTEDTPEYYFAVWPAGYPLLLAGISWVAGCTPLVASKICNLLALGAIFLLLLRWAGPKAWFPLLAFCSFDMLEVFSYSWSEPPFLFFVILFCFLMHQSLQQEPRFLALKLSLCLICLFLFRYAGLIYFFLAGLFALYFLLRKDWVKLRPFIAALTIAGIFVLLYFYHNYTKTGFPTGQSRFHPEGLGGVNFLKVLLHGLWNSFSIARNYYFAEDYLYLFLFALQGCLILFLLAHRKKAGSPFLLPASAAQVLVLSSLFYLCWIVFLRRVSPLNDFNYRLLAPFVLPFYLGLFMAVLDHPRFYQKTYPWITAFMLFSLLMNLPKVYIWKQLAGLL